MPAVVVVVVVVVVVDASARGIHIVLGGSVANRAAQYLHRARTPNIIICYCLRPALCPDPCAVLGSREPPRLYLTYA